MVKISYIMFKITNEGDIMEKVLVIGSTVCDIMIYVDQLPTTKGDVHVKEQVMSVGGCAYNVVNVLHHLDVPNTFISPVGIGMYGDFVKQSLKETGIVPEVTVDEANGCCYCFVETGGERTFISHHGVEYTFNPDWLKHLDLDEYRYVYICGLEIEERDGDKIIETLKEIKAEIIFCPGPRGHLIETSKLESVYQLNPIVHLNDSEVMTLTDTHTVEEAVVKMYEKTNNKVIVTLGEQGALYYDGQLSYVATSKAKVVDTIGAGDSHVGGVLASLSYGHDMVDAIVFGNQVSGKVVGVQGVQLGKESFETLKALL